jgi:DNA polymerase epsilon subunit 1
MGKEGEVEDGLRRKFDKLIERIEKIQKDDLDLPNHLSGMKRNYLKLYFRNTGDLDKVKRVLQPIATRNGEAYRDGIIPIGMMSSSKPDDGNYRKAKAGEAGGHALDGIVDLREHDVPYALRVSIDHGICVGLWYNVKINGPTAQISVIRDKDVRPDPVILAFDIETSKSPLKFPDAAVDAIMMISYMINGQVPRRMILYRH